MSAPVRIVLEVPGGLYRDLVNTLSEQRSNVRSECMRHLEELASRKVKARPAPAYAQLTTVEPPPAPVAPPAPKKSAYEAELDLQMTPVQHALMDEMLRDRTALTKIADELGVHDRTAARWRRLVWAEWGPQADTHPPVSPRPVKPSRPAGRPPRWPAEGTPEQVAELVRMANRRMSIPEMARALQVGENTVRRWREAANLPPLVRGRRPNIR